MHKVKAFLKKLGRYNIYSSWFYLLLMVIYSGGHFYNSEEKLLAGNKNIR